MNDLIERLRIMDVYEDSSHLRLDAIDEIERLTRELAEARGLLREAFDSLPTQSKYESRVEYLRDLRARIDAALADQPGAVDCS